MCMSPRAPLCKQLHAARLLRRIAAVETQQKGVLPRGQKKSPPAVHVQKPPHNNNGQ